MIHLRFAVVVVSRRPCQEATEDCLDEVNFAVQARQVGGLDAAVPNPCPGRQTRLVESAVPPTPGPLCFGWPTVLRVVVSEVYEMHSSSSLLEEVRVQSADQELLGVMRSSLVP